MDSLNRTISQAPQCLTRIVKGMPYYLVKGKKWKIKYDKTKKTTSFSWGLYKGISISEHIVNALQLISEKHCFYCDANRQDYGLNRPEIDHFCPKTRIPVKAYYYPNLFLSCTSCNGYKKSRYNKKAFLKFDDPTYTFDDFYFIDFSTGKIRVRPDIDHSNQIKARYTIMVLGINNAARPTTRKKELDSYLDTNHPNLNDFSYRFFITRGI